MRNTGVGISDITAPQISPGNRRLKRKRGNREEINFNGNSGLHLLVICFGLAPPLRARRSGYQGAIFAATIWLWKYRHNNDYELK
jgi:hypothetical protein